MTHPLELPQAIAPLPCPWCGSTATTDLRSNILGLPDFAPYWVMCSNVNCDAQGPIDNDRANAISMWNLVAGRDPK